MFPTARKIRIACFVYRRLLIFYPHEFRCRFGDEMEDVFRNMACDAAEKSRSGSMFLLWCSALRELLTVAAPLRLQNNAVIAGALSLPVSATLVLAFFRAVS